jgi:hypothetical protein
MPMCVKIISEGLKNFLRGELEGDHYRNRGDLLHIGEVAEEEILNKIDGNGGEENWINYIGCSRIDGYPMFLIPHGAIREGNGVQDTIRDNGLMILSREGTLKLFKDEHLGMTLVSRLEDHNFGFGELLTSGGGMGQKPKGKQIFCDIDPYGEESWENEI